MYVLAYVGIMANNMAIPAMGCLGYPCNGLPRLYPCNGLPPRLPRIIGSLPLKRIPRVAATMFRCTINTSKSTANTSTRCHRAHLRQAPAPPAPSTSAKHQRQCCCAEARSSAWGDVRHVLLAVFGEVRAATSVGAMSAGRSPSRRTTSRKSVNAPPPF